MKIESDDEHAAILREIARLMQVDGGRGPVKRRLRDLADAAEAYERKRWPIPKPSWIGALLFRMEHQFGYLRFVDNWHKWPPLSRLLCAIGRHDFEASEIQIWLRAVDLECFYCGRRRRSFLPYRGSTVAVWQRLTPRT